MRRRPPTRAGLALAMATLLNTPAQADMISSEGMAPWERCAECHDLTGVSPRPRFPHLAGQRRAYIEKQVMDFRIGNRANARGQMEAVVTELSPDDVRRVATYFSELEPPEPRRHELSEVEHEKAARLFERGRSGMESCLSCHGVGTSEYLAPALEAQHAEYIEKELHDFRDGHRRNDPGGVMGGVARKLTEDEIGLLSRYIAGLTRPVSDRAKGR